MVGNPIPEVPREAANTHHTSSLYSTQRQYAISQSIALTNKTRQKISSYLDVLPTLPKKILAVKESTYFSFIKFCLLIVSFNFSNCIHGNCAKNKVLVETNALMYSSGNHYHVVVSYRERHFRWDWEPRPAYDIVVLRHWLHNSSFTNCKELLFCGCSQYVTVAGTNTCTNIETSITAYSARTLRLPTDNLSLQKPKFSNVFYCMAHKKTSTFSRLPCFLNVNIWHVSEQA